MNGLDRASRVRWFSTLADRLGISLDPKFNLVLEAKMPENSFKNLKDATLCYIRACMGEEAATGLAEQELLEKAAKTLANRTPNGVLIPKQEFEGEFNALHGVVASWLQSLGADDLISSICCPIVVRLPKGESNPELERSRPYSSTKLHSDIWTGEPPDFLGIRIPVAGDIEKTTIDFFHPPEDFETNYLRWLDDYDEARELGSRSEKYPLVLRAGRAYFVDGTVLHQTVKKGGGARVSVHIELRRTPVGNQAELAEKMSSPERTAHYIPRDEWYAFGVTKFMKMRETYADAARGVFKQCCTREDIYQVVDRL